MSDRTAPMAVHLAAGKGTRLRPITDDRPKPLVELGGTSLLERNVETLREGGIDDQLVVTGYLAERIETLGYETVHNDEYDVTDMVYSLFCARERFPTDRDLVVSYGDIIYERRVVDALLASDAGVAVVVDREWRRLWEDRFDEPLDDAETLRVDDHGQIAEIGGETDEIEDIEGQYVGLIKVDADRVESFVRRYSELEDAQEDAHASVEMTAFLQSLIDDGWDVEAVSIEGGWLEIDTIDDLKLYRDRHRTGTLDEYVDLRD